MYKPTKPLLHAVASENFMAAVLGSAAYNEARVRSRGCALGRIKRHPAGKR